MEAKFSPRVKDVITFSKEEALRLGNDFIGVEHLLLGIIREGEGKAIQILKEFKLDLKSIRLELEAGLTKSVKSFSQPMANIPLVKQTEKVLKFTFQLESPADHEVCGTVRAGRNHSPMDATTYASGLLTRLTIPKKIATTSPTRTVTKTVPRPTEPPSNQPASKNTASITKRTRPIGIPVR